MKTIFKYLTLAAFGLCLLETADAAPSKKKKKASVFPNVELAADMVDGVKTAAESGDAEALRKLGHYYMQQAQDAKGRECFLKAAEAGDAEARAWYALALYYQHNRSPQGEKLALEQALISAEAGNLMGMYFSGLFGHKDDELARKWLEKAAKGGFAPAMRVLAWKMQLESVGASERERKKFLALYDKAMKSGDITSVHAGTGKSGYIFERFAYARTNRLLRQSIELAKKRSLCWYDTCFDFNFPLDRFAHGAAKYYLVILGYKSLELAADKEKNKMDICTRNRKELYDYLEKQAEMGDPAACHAIVSLIELPHLFWSCRPDVSFSNPDKSYWRQKAEVLKKTAPPLYRKLRYPF